MVELLAGESCCLTAEEIAARLRAGGEPVGIASVYRALDLLGEIGLVQRVEVGDGTARYESMTPGGEHHHHVLCETCGRLTPFEDDSLERAMGRLADRLEHDVRGHDVLIRGECRRCGSQARRSPQSP